MHILSICKDEASEKEVRELIDGIGGRRALEEMDNAIRHMQTAPLSQRSTVLFASITSHSSGASMFSSPEILYDYESVVVGRYMVDVPGRDRRGLMLVLESGDLVNFSRYVKDVKDWIEEIEDGSGVDTPS